MRGRVCVRVGDSSGVGGCTMGPRWADARRQQRGARVGFALTSGVRDGRASCFSNDIGRR